VTQGIDRVLTTSPHSTTVNALGSNSDTGLVYYGSGSKVYLWDSVAGTSVANHLEIHDFATGSVTAPITNLNSGAGGFLDGLYYVGSESDNGLIRDVWEITLAADGRSVIAARPLNILNACNCAAGDIGGFGDIAVIREGGDLIIYGSTAVEAGGAGTNAGRWRLNSTQNTFQLLATGSGGQISRGIDGRLYTNVAQDIFDFDPITGNASGQALMRVSGPIFDFSSGITIDYGDAPMSYGIASHIFNPELVGGNAYLGQVPPDNEAYVLNGDVGGVDFRGDDNQAASDEDAVAGPVLIDQTDTSYSLTIACSPSSQVAGWIDANFNGRFDASERNTNYPLSCAGGSATLNWTSLSVTYVGRTGLRLRAGQAASDVEDPTGRVLSGEVEDHEVIVDGVVSGNCPIGDNSIVVEAADLPQRIGPNRNTVTNSTITVAESETISDVNVINVEGTHSYMNDLIFRLIHNGTTIVLYGPECNGSNNFNTGFDDEAVGSVPCPPTNNRNYPPDMPLSIFDGTDSAGDWTLQIVDRFNQDGGSLESWELEICTTPDNSAISDIRLGKSASVNGDVVSFVLLARNTGDTLIEEVELFDDLDAVFGSGNYELVDAPTLLTSPPGFEINEDFTGENGDIELLDNSGELDLGEEIRISFSVRVLNFQNPNATFQNAATVNAVTEAGDTVSDESGPGLDVTSDVDGPTVFTFDPPIILSGSVFLDQSTSVSNSHDGVRQADELGVGARQVRIVDLSTNTDIQSVTTDANGEWTVSLDSQFDGVPIAVVVSGSTDLFISESPQYSVGVVTDGTLQITPTFATAYEALDVGVIPNPELQQSQSQTVNVGGRALYEHQYTVPSHGEISFDLTTG